MLMSKSCCGDSLLFMCVCVCERPTWRTHIKNEIIIIIIQRRRKRRRGQTGEYRQGLMTGHKSLRKGKKKLNDGWMVEVIVCCCSWPVWDSLSVCQKIYLHSWPYWNDVIHFDSNSIFDSIRRIQVGRWLSQPAHKEANRHKTGREKKNNRSSLSSKEVSDTSKWC